MEVLYCELLVLKLCIESEKENGLVKFHVFPTPNTNLHLKK